MNRINQRMSHPGRHQRARWDRLSRNMRLIRWFRSCQSVPSCSLMTTWMTSKRFSLVPSLLWSAHRQSTSLTPPPFICNCEDEVHVHLGSSPHKIRKQTLGGCRASILTSCTQIYIMLIAELMATNVRRGEEHENVVETAAVRSVPTLLFAAIVMTSFPLFRMPS